MLVDFDYNTVKTRYKFLTVIETIILTIFGIAVCYFINPKDALFVHGPFPFILIAPFLIALLYGLSYGVLSYILALLAAITLGQEVSSQFDYYLYVFTTATMLIIMGQFGSYWKKRMSHIEQFNNYLFQRLDKLTQAYYFIKISHDTIEDQFIANPFSLRNTLHTIQKMLEKTSGELTKNILAESIQMVAKYLDIQKAQFHFAGEDGNILPEPAFVLDEKADIDVVNDPLVQSSFKNKETGFISPNDFDEFYQSAFIISVPMIDANNKIFGYFLIQEIAFRSLNENSVEKLTIILSYLSNIRDACQISSTIREKYPDCPLGFANEVSVLSNLKAQYDIDSLFVSIRIHDNERAQFFVENLRQIKRNTDYVWVQKKESVYAVIFFMPLESRDKTYFFTQRVKKYFIDTYQIDIVKEGLIFDYLPMSSKDAVGTIENLLNNIQSKK